MSWTAVARKGPPSPRPRLSLLVMLLRWYRRLSMRCIPLSGQRLLLPSQRLMPSEQRRRTLLAPRERRLRDHSAPQRREVSAAVASSEPHSLICSEPRRLPLAVAPQALAVAVCLAVPLRLPAAAAFLDLLRSRHPCAVPLHSAARRPVVLAAAPLVPIRSVVAVAVCLAVPIPLPLPLPIPIPHCRVTRPTGSAASHGTPLLRRCP